MKFRHLTPLLFLLPFLAACGSREGALPAGTPPGGIVTLAPHLTETVFALGEGERVVGVGDFDDYPPEVAALPKLGGYIDPNLERIALLAPSLIILPGQHQAVAGFAKLHGFRVLQVNMDSLASIRAGFLTIGAAVGCPDAAARLRGDFDAGLDAVRDAVADLPRVKVLIITSRTTHDLDTLYTAGGPSFLSEITAAAGGDSIYADTKTPYLEASKETVVMAAPEAILEFHCGEDLSPAESEAYLADWQALPSVPAVRAGQVYLVTAAHGERPGPRLPEIARTLAILLHPGVEFAP